MAQNTFTKSKARALSLPLRARVSNTFPVPRLHWTLNAQAKTIKQYNQWQPHHSQELPCPLAAYKCNLYAHNSTSHTNLRTMPTQRYSRRPCSSTSSLRICTCKGCRIPSLWALSTVLQPKTLGVLIWNHLICRHSDRHTASEEARTCEA